MLYQGVTEEGDSPYNGLYGGGSAQRYLYQALGILEGRDFTI